MTSAAMEIEPRLAAERSPTVSPTTPPPPLVERLRACAQVWAEANGAGLSQLSRLVLNDGGYFSRVSGEGASTTTATLEKFARFLTDPANWPALAGREDGAAAVPREVCDFAHAVGISSAACAVSAGNGGQSSGTLRQAQGERDEDEPAEAAE